MAEAKVTIKNFTHDFIEDKDGSSKISITGYVTDEEEKQTIYFESDDTLLEKLGAEKVTVRDVAGKVIRVMAVPAALAGGFVGAYMMLNEDQRNNLIEIMNHAKSMAMEAGANVSEAIAYAQTQLSKYIGNLSEYIGNLSEYVSDYVRAAATYGSNAIYALTDKILTFFGGVSDMIRGMFKDVAGSVTSAVGGIDNGIREIGTRMVSNATNATQNATETVQQWWNSSVGSDNTSNEVSSWWSKFTRFDWNIYMIGTMAAVLGVTIGLAYLVYRKYAADVGDNSLQGGAYSQLLPMFSLAASYIQQAVTTIEKLIPKQKYTTVLYMALGTAVGYLIHRIFTLFGRKMYQGKSMLQILKNNSVKQIMETFRTFMGNQWEALLAEISKQWDAFKRRAKQKFPRVAERVTEAVDGAQKMGSAVYGLGKSVVVTAQAAQKGVGDAVQEARKQAGLLGKSAVEAASVAKRVMEDKMKCGQFNGSPGKCWGTKGCYYNDGKDNEHLQGAAGTCRPYFRGMRKAHGAIDRARQRYQEQEQARIAEQRQMFSEDHGARDFSRKRSHCESLAEKECHNDGECRWVNDKCEQLPATAVYGGSDDNKGGIFY